MLYLSLDNPTASGLLWFQPKLFGNEWSKLTGKELKPAKKWIILAWQSSGNDFSTCNYH